MLTFIVNDIPPTYITCLKDGTAMNDSNITREIINPLYMETGNSVSVRVKMALKTRDPATYLCTVEFFKHVGVVDAYYVQDEEQVPELNTSISISGESLCMHAVYEVKPRRMA